MKIPVRRLAFAVLILASVSAQAVDLELPAAKYAGSLPIDVRDIVPARDHFGRPLSLQFSRTPFSRAVDQAWKKDPSEENLKAWSEVLVRCQQATNPAWSTAISRSDSQQDHCYRY